MSDAVERRDATDESTEFGREMAAVAIDVLTTPVRSLGQMCPIRVQHRPATERILAAAFSQTERLATDDRIATLQRLVIALADRVAGQSEALTKIGELKVPRSKPKPIGPCSRCGKPMTTASCGNFYPDGKGGWVNVCYPCLRPEED